MFLYSITTVSNLHISLEYIWFITFKWIEDGCERISKDGRLCVKDVQIIHSENVVFREQRERLDFLIWNWVTARNEKNS